MVHGPKTLASPGLSRDGGSVEPSKVRLEGGGQCERFKSSSLMTFIKLWITWLGKMRQTRPLCYACR